MHDDAFPWRQPALDLHVRLVVLTDDYMPKSRHIVLYSKDGPTLAIPEQRRLRHLQRVLAFPNNDARLNTVAVAQPASALTRLGQFDQDIHALFFDAERGHLGVCERLDSPHHACKRSWSAPTLDEHAVAGAYAYRIL